MSIQISMFRNNQGTRGSGDNFLKKHHSKEQMVLFTKRIEKIERGPHSRENIV